MIRCYCGICVGEGAVENMPKRRTAMRRCGCSQCLLGPRDGLFQPRGCRVFVLYLISPLPDGRDSFFARRFHLSLTPSRRGAMRVGISLAAPGARLILPNFQPAAGRRVVALRMIAGGLALFEI